MIKLKNNLVIQEIQVVLKVLNQKRIFLHSNKYNKFNNHKFYKNKLKNKIKKLI